MDTTGENRPGDATGRRAGGSDRSSFIDRVVDLLRPLSSYARGHLQLHEALGELVPGSVRAEEVVDAALLEALARADEAPLDRLYPWLRGFVRRAMARELAQARRRRRERSLDEPVGTGWPDEAGTRPPRRLIDVLPDPNAPIPEEVVASAEFLRARLAEEYEEATVPPTETLFAAAQRAEPTPEQVARTRSRLEAAAA